MNRVLEFSVNLDWTETCNFTYVLNVHKFENNNVKPSNVNITMLHEIVEVKKKSNWSPNDTK